MSTEDGLDLVHQATTRVSLAVASVSSVAVLVGHTGSRVLSSSQTSLGIRVVVGTAGRRRAVGKVTGGSVSGDTGVLVLVRIIVAVTVVDARSVSVNIESVSACGTRQVTAGDALVAGVTAVSCVSCGSVLSGEVVSGTVVGVAGLLEKGRKKRI